jgi:hypothetical protein
VNRLLLILLLGLGASVLMVPFLPSPGDLVRADVQTSGDRVLLAGDGGQLELPLPVDDVYSSSDPYDFFPELVDPASIERVEFLPYGEGISCNVVTDRGHNVAGDPLFCVVLVVKLEVPAFVHPSLLSEQEFTPPGSLRA